MDVINLNELEALAQQKLNAMAFGYYVSGANDELTLRENRNAYSRLELAYRVMRAVGKRDTSTRILDTKIAMPVMFAPTAFQQLANPEGEIATAKAAGAANTIMMLSTLSNKPLEEVAKSSSFPIWFQLYVYKDRSISVEVVKRAEAAGCKALVLTVDAPVLGRRERDVRNQFHLPADMVAANMVPAGCQSMPQQAHGSGLGAYFESLLDPNLSWDDVAWLRSITSLPLFIKGVVRPDDAVLALEHGCDGIVVSNHGGRQLDTSPATIRVLPKIAHAVRRHPRGVSATLLMDGGVRRGTDVLKAVALGADAVLLGRPVLWSLAIGGSNGVVAMWDLLRREFDTAMALCGCRNVAEITPDLILENPAV